MNETVGAKSDQPMGAAFGVLPTLLLDHVSGLQREVRKSMDNGQREKNGQWSLIQQCVHVVVVLMMVTDYSGSSADQKSKKTSFSLRSSFSFMARTRLETCLSRPLSTRLATSGSASKMLSRS